MSVGLDAWLARIEKLHPSEIELGLERVRRVAEALGAASLPMPVITVAGTNGKGSVVALTRALAAAAGRRVCVYTSPHLQRFNERITLPDGPVDDDALCAAFEQVDAARGDTALTYFEFTTLAALWLFRHSGADLAILEVGLGGRLDAVNLIDADVAVVTSVGLDHTDWLGDTREKVAVEKLGIGRAGRPLVYGEDDAPANLDAELDRLGAVPLRAGREFRVRPPGCRSATANGTATTRCRCRRAWARTTWPPPARRWWPPVSHRRTTPPTRWRIPVSSAAARCAVTVACSACSTWGIIWKH